MTWTYLQQAKKKRETTNNKQILDYLTIWGKRFSSVTRFPPNISLQSSEHCFMENHGESRLSSNYYHASSVNYHVYFLRDISFFFCWVSCQQEKGEATILSPLFHFHQHRKSFGLQRLHLLQRFHDKRGLPKQIHKL